MTSKSERRRRQLLELGVELFADHPYDEVAIGDLARVGGISKGLLYHYFGNKKAFYLACVGHVANGLVREMAAIDSSQGAGSIDAGIRHFLRHLERHGKTYRSLMIGTTGGDLGVQALFDQTRHAIAAVILTELGVPLDNALFRSTTRAWIASVEAAALDRMEHGSPSEDLLVRMQTRALADRLLLVHTLQPGIADEDTMALVAKTRQATHHTA